MARVPRGPGFYFIGARRPVTRRTQAANGVPAGHWMGWMDAEMEKDLEARKRREDEKKKKRKQKKKQNIRSRPRADDNSNQPDS